MHDVGGGVALGTHSVSILIQLPSQAAQFSIGVDYALGLVRGEQVILPGGAFLAFILVYLEFHALGVGGGVFPGFAV